MDNRYPLLDMSPNQAYEQFMVPGIMCPGVDLLLKYALPRLGERVLDVACGTGIVARTVAPIVGAQGKVTALDINPAMLAVARNLPQPDGAAIEWREGSVLSMPFSDGDYDLVLCNQGVQFFPDKVAALREVHRVLMAGRRVVVNVNQGLPDNPLYAALNDVFIRHMNVPAIAAPFSFGEADALAAVLRDAGFSQVEVIPLTHSIRFPSLSTYIQASIVGSAAVLQELARLDADAKTKLADQITDDMQDTLKQYVESDGTLEMPLNTNIGRGVA